MRLKASGLGGLETAALAGPLNSGLQAGAFARFGELDDCTASKRGKLYCD